MIEKFQNIPRKNLRYLFFCERDGICSKAMQQIQNISDNLKSEIISFYESQQEFDGWENFDKTWDIGIESSDKETQLNRPTKFYLYNQPKTKIIPISALYQTLSSK